MKMIQLKFSLDNYNYKTFKQKGLILTQSCWIIHISNIGGSLTYFLITSFLPKPFWFLAKLNEICHNFFRIFQFYRIHQNFNNSSFIIFENNCSICLTFDCKKMSLKIKFKQTTNYRKGFSFSSKSRRSNTIRNLKDICSLQTDVFNSYNRLQREWENNNCFSLSY